MNKKTYQWVEDATTRYEREIINAKRRVTYHKNQEKKGMNAFIRNSFLVFTVLGLVGVPVNNFFGNNTVSFRSPVVIEKRTSDFHSPITVVSAQETKEVKVAGQEAEINKEKVYEQMYGDVWNRESSKGTNLSGLNGYCHSIGMINEIGYAPKDKYCFKDRTEQHETFLLWSSNRSGKNCVMKGFCRETFEGLLRLYSNNEYELFYYQKYAFAIPEVK